jgi:serpin B
MHARRASLGLGSVTALLGLGLLSVGCSGQPTNGESSDSVISELRSVLPRTTADASEATRASQSEQAFAMSFLQALDADSNLAFSPHSLSTAFAMLTDAASGETLQEVEQVFAFDATDSAFHRSQDALELELASRNRPAVDNDERRIDAQVLSASNDIWLRDDVPPTPAYLDTLARYYGVGVHQADFAKRTEQARAAINAKVSDDTHDLITQLIPRGALTTDTVAVLTNAVYFKAPWVTPLGGPALGDFHALDGSITRADMMRTNADLRYYAGDNFVSVALPYFAQQLEMLLIVPNADAYADVRGALTSELLSQVVAESLVEPVDLTLPKFDVKSVIPAAETLQSLGLLRAFDETQAEFPAFASDVYDNVYLSEVLHQATVAIDEKGTEASAATAVVLNGLLIGIDAEPTTPKVVVADRPFLFVIRDNPTGALLFVGQVVAP